MKKIDGAKFPNPTIKEKVPLCCLIRPVYICSLCRAQLCSDCNEKDKESIEEHLDTDGYLTYFRNMGHASESCWKKNSEEKTTWEMS